MSLSNKSVCVVSYAKYMENKKMGKIIDSYDKVVRINNGINIPKDLYDDFGSKKDIYAGSFCGGKNNFILKTYCYLNKKKERINIFDILKKYDIKDVIICKSKSQHIEDFAKNNNYNVLVPNIKHKEWAITTGLQSIINILSLKPKELFVTGFSFTMELHSVYEKYYLMFKKGSIESLGKNYDVDKNCKHSTIMEKYLMKLLQKKYKFSIDNELKNILRNFNISELHNIINPKVGKKYKDIYREVINYIEK